jgi:arylsulfatase A-like enzyme
VTKRSAQPNVVLLVFDTARADVLEPYGAEPGSSPALAALARSGWAAPGCYATSNWTLPSHLSLFTGLLPRAAGLGPEVPAGWVVRTHADRSIASVLRSRGYETSGLTANPWVTRNHGFAEGFDRYIRVRRSRRDAPHGDLKTRMRWLLQAVNARVDDGLREIEATMGSWIDERPSKPFFWFANLMECHSPYLPPAPYNDLGLVQRLRAARDAARIQSHNGFITASVGLRRVSESSRQRMWYLYRRAVRSMDDFLERLMNRLDVAGLLDDSIVVVVSDHGENFGEGGLYSHLLSLDDRLIRVPFVVGGGVPVEEPAAPTSLADIPRVLASALGISDHPWHDTSPVDGVAVAQYDGFASFTPDIAERLAGGLGIDEEHRAMLFRGGECVTDGRFKLVRTEGVEQLFDVATDPLETSDVSQRWPEHVDRLRRALATVEGLPRATVEEPRTDEPEDTRAASELEEQMRILGYL